MSNKIKLDLSTHGVMEGIPGGGPNAKILKTVFGEAERKETSTKTNYKNVPLEEITPRPVNRFRQTSINRLAKSISAIGMINPIILVNIKHLSDDSEIKKSFSVKGLDPEKIHYVIVSGERRFRAYKLLFETEKSEKPQSPSLEYQYAKIPARILTREEAQSEELIYKDSNIETRQLSSLEIMINCREMMKDVSTEEEKRQALIDMGLDPEKNRFNQVKYCKFFFENELGIQDVTESNLKQTLATVQQCIPEVLDLVIDGYISMGKAREIRGVPEDTQRELVKLIKEGDAERVAVVLDKFKKKEEVVQARLTHKDAARMVEKGIDDFTKQKKKLETVLKNLSGNDEKLVHKIIDKLNELVDEWKGYYETLK